MHQVSLETICPLKAFQLHYCPAKNAKSMVKHFIFLHKFSVCSTLPLSILETQTPTHALTRAQMQLAHTHLYTHSNARTHTRKH